MQKNWLVMVNDGTAEIFLYGFIDSFDVSAGDFVKELRSLEAKHQNINVRINSGGGNVFEGLAIYNAMKQSPANIETYIDGLAASMASIIALGGKKCHMSKSARIMTHQPSSGTYGNKEELEKTKLLLEGIEKTMAAIYAAKTGKNEEDCRTAFMNGKDTWFTADEAMAAGLVDAIYDADAVEVPAAAMEEKPVWEIYQHKLVAKLNQSNNTMKQYQISAAVLAAMSLTAEATDAQVEAKINDLVARATKADQYKQEKEAAEQKLADELKAINTGKVNDLVTAALTEKKITAALAETLKADYAENPDGLAKVLGAIPKPVSVVDSLKPSGEETEEQLKAEWQKLDKTNGLEKLKAENIDRYKQLFAAQFGREYKG